MKETNNNNNNKNNENGINKPTKPPIINNLNIDIVQLQFNEYHLIITYI